MIDPPADAGGTDLTTHAAILEKTNPDRVGNHPRFDRCVPCLGVLCRTKPPSCKLRDDFSRLTGHMLDHCAGRSGRDLVSAEYENGLLPIGPRVKSQHRLESLTADDQRIDRGHELVVAVWFTAARWQKIEGAIGPCDKAVEAGANKNGSFHSRVLMKSFERRKFRVI